MSVASFSSHISGKPRNGLYMPKAKEIGLQPLEIEAAADQHRHKRDKKEEIMRAAPPPTWAIHTAFLFLGVASFLLSNSIWADMSSIYRVLPEANRLGSYLLVCLQLGNIVPAFCMIEGSHLRWLSLESAIWVILILGFVISQLISFLWSKTDDIGGHPHSVALLVLTFLVGCINNSSGLAFYPFVARFERRYVSTLATGEGLSGIIVAILAALQDAGGQHQRFPSTAYFQCVSSIYALSFLSYFLLLRCEARITTSVSSSRGREHDELESSSATSYKRIEEVPVLLDGCENGPLGTLDATALLEEPIRSAQEAMDHQLPSSFSRRRTIFRLTWPILIIQAIISALAYGVIPAILPIASTGYQHESHILQYSSFLSMTADPVARAITHVFHCYRLKVLLLLVMGFAAVIIISASLCPHPPLSTYTWGGLLIIFINGSFTSAFAFTSTMVFFTVRRVLTLPSASASSAEPFAINGGTLLPSPSSSSSDPTAPGSRGRGRGSNSSPIPPPMTAEQLDRWQDGFKWSAFAIQAGAFCGSVLTFCLAVS